MNYLVKIMNSKIKATQLHKQYFDLAYTKMVDCINQSFSSSEEESQRAEAHLTIHSCLHALLNYYERLRFAPNFISSTETVNYMDAFRLANDKLKHDPSLINSAKIVNSFTLPIMFPIKLGMHYHWGELKDFIDEKRPKDPKRYEQYKRLLQEKEVRCTFQIIKKLLENSNEDIDLNI
jgi:hypothetical protein